MARDYRGENDAFRFLWGNGLREICSERRGFNQPLMPTPDGLPGSGGAWIRERVRMPEGTGYLDCRRIKIGTLFRNAKTPLTFPEKEFDRFGEAFIISTKWAAIGCCQDMGP